LVHFVDDGWLGLLREVAIEVFGRIAIMLRLLRLAKVGECCD